MGEVYSGIKFNAVNKGDWYPNDFESQTIKKLLILRDYYKEKGFIELNGGNFSGRVENGFVIKKTGILIEKLTSSDFAKVTSVEGDSVSFQGSGNPSSESRSHFMIYRAHPEYNFIFHGHLPAFNKYLELANDQCLLEEQPYGTIELAKQVSQNIGTNEFVLIKNHGFFVAGKTFENAFQKMNKLYERYKRIKI